MSDPMVLTYEERGGGPALVLIHGFPLNSSMWIEQLKGLAKVRTVIAVNLRGHGYTQVDSADGFSMDLFADDVAATLDDIGVDKADICGLSMGGYVAMAFWRRHKDKVRSMIFADTKPEADSDEAKAGREKTAAAVREQGIQPLVDGVLPKMFGPNPSEELVAATRAMFESTPPEVAAADLLAMRDRPDSDLSVIDVPCLWIHGEGDQIMPIDAARTAAGTIPDCTFVAVPDAGHMSPLENPGVVIPAMTEFLQKVGK
ncbi:MAG TPA: alpha/beta fold hydrolase [Actinomycetota bacterium]|nr:alpha/beta fold hydrolase [Actinomycetota bacterium]